MIKQYINLAYFDLLSEKYNKFNFSWCEKMFSSRTLTRTYGELIMEVVSLVATKNMYGSYRWWCPQSLPKWHGGDTKRGLFTCHGGVK